LMVRPPPSEGTAEKLDEPEYRDLAKSLRGEFQPALLGWLRDPTNKSSLQKIAEIFDQLKSRTGVPVLEQLFWVTGGFLEAMREDGLEITPERKKLFARLDQHIKKIIDGADRSTVRIASEDLTRALLWEIAQSKPVGTRVTPLKRAFNLEFLLSGDTEAAAPANPDLPTPEALASVSTALGKEIEAAQDLMSTYFDPENRGSTSLEPLVESFRKMAGTLDMLNVPMLKTLVEELSITCQAVIDEKIANPAVISMPMAEALLMVESSTRDISRSPTEWKKQIEDAIHQLHAIHSPDEANAMPASDGLEVSDAELTESDYKQLVSVVAGEVSINLGRIEEALEGFAADVARVEALDEVPHLLSQILGAMEILGQAHAAKLVEVTRQHVEDIRRGMLVADSTIMDGLAVSVGTIGAYVEGLRAERSNLESLIDAALAEMENALASGHGRQRDPALLIDGVRLSLESWLDDVENAEARGTLSRQLSDLTQLAQEQGKDKIARISVEMDHLLTLVAEDSSKLSDEIVETLKQSFTAMSAMAGRRMTLRTTTSVAPDSANSQSAAPATSASASKPVANVERARPTPAAAPSRPVALDPDFDAEIMEIFVEDARDVLENIKSKFSVWRDDTENQNALTELRRGYHTLKGSGRMVGASEVAELAWDVENILNRIREGKISASGEIVDLMQETQDALPQLIDVLAGGPQHNVDVETLRENARSLAESGGKTATPQASPKTAAAGSRDPQPAPATQPAKGDLPKLEKTLLEIFTTEALSNLDNIHQQIVSCREAGGSCFVTDSFFRSAHTLQGNARSLGLQVMSESCAEIEKLLHALKTENLPLNSSYLDLASRFEECVRKLVELLNRGATSSGNLGRDFMNLARELRVASHEVESGEGTERPAATASTSPAPVQSRPVQSLPAELVIEEPAGQSDPVDPELMEIFLEEATDIMANIEASLTHWRGQPDDRAQVAELKRALHTLKGGARMAGALSMGNLSHNTETLLKYVEDNSITTNNDIFDLLDEVHDTLVAMLDGARKGQTFASATQLNNKLLALFSGGSEPEAPAVEQHIAPEIRTPEPEFAPHAEYRPEPRQVESAVPTSSSVIVDEVDERRDQADAEEKQWPEKLERRGQVRVDTGLLNELVNYAGEVSLSRSRMEQQIYSFRDNLGELSRNIVRFREQIRELEIQSESQILYRMEQDAKSSGKTEDFDPLEFDRYSRLQQLSRSLAESLHDLGTIQNSLGNFVGEAESVLQQQARINTDLQEGLMRTRMVSFSTQAARLRHIVRQTGRELGKRVELHLENPEVELDRNVLERMIGPFEHMIRNSIDHGIEPEAERRRKGKPPQGRINIATSQEGSEVIIRFSDDGAGLNIEGIRKKAIERGMTTADAALTEEELIQFILMPGFSTAEKITHFSGRGVGMDVVHSEVKQLGGSMSVDTEAGQGTTFIVHLPLTLSITQALMVYIGEQLYAVPLGSVVNIIEMPIEKIANISMGKNPLLSYNEQVFPYMHLGQRLNINSQPRNGKKVPILLARAGTREVAIQIDGLGGTREVVIKSLGPQLSELKGLAGATILGDGRVVLILDVPGLWFRDDTIHFEHQQTGKVAQEVRARPVIMVVDDSLTVRKITSKHLQKRGMDVLVAKDGLDAVEQLRDHTPDVMLVDIEMPRMDGYELTTRVRSDENLQHIPIIMITSRAGAKHRQKALDLGVDMYMSKPYQEDELFKNIDQLIATGRPA